jgi:tryptophan synthase alpha chain
MNIEEKFNSLKNNNEAALIIYLTAGFPTLKESIENLQIISDSGADIIEIGVPFSDPIADGPTIQMSSQIALQNGINLKNIIHAIKEVDIETPLVVMSYLNPLRAYGKHTLFSDFKEAGISGIIIPDLPVEESYEWIELSKANKIDLIFLVAPTTSENRIQMITDQSNGFIYCVSVTGITGVRKELTAGLPDFVKRVKSKTRKPVAVGFGISNSDQIQELSRNVDGVIVGSRIIEAIRQKENLNDIVTEMKQATKRT